MDIVDKIIDFEEGNMSDQEIVDFFQEIVNSGIVWQLQGTYHRLANDLIETGLVKEN